MRGLVKHITLPRTTTAADGSIEGPTSTAT